MPVSNPRGRPLGPALALLPLVALAGCGSRPSAPPLEQGSVYRNSREGFRFLAPEGWQQVARGEVPPGKVEGERMLVEYRCLTCAARAALLVTVADVPAKTPLGAYVTKHNFTGEAWRSAGPTEDFTINGVPAVRLTYTMGGGKDQTVREIVAFRKGERVYFFKGIYGRSDTKSRKDIRAAVDSIVW